MRHTPQLMLQSLAVGACTGGALAMAPRGAAAWQLIVGCVLVLVFSFHACSALWVGARVPMTDRIGTILHGLSFAILGAAALVFPHRSTPWLAFGGIAWLFLARRLYELALPSSRSS